MKSLAALFPAEWIGVDQERVRVPFVADAVLAVAKERCRFAAVDRLYYSTLAKGRIEM